MTTTIASQLHVTVRAHTGWARLILRVAQLLARLHAPILIPLWLRAMQPTCVIALWVEGSYRRVGPFRLRRWSLARVPLPRVNVTVRGRRKARKAV